MWKPTLEINFENAYFEDAILFAAEFLHMYFSSKHFQIGLQDKHWQDFYPDSLGALFQRVEWKRNNCSQGKCLKWAQRESR